MFHFTHTFVSQKADGTDPTVVRPRDWNAEHAATADGPGVVGRTASGAGPLDLLALGSFFLPSGIALPWFGSPASIPAGWLLCNGQLVSRTLYPNLFIAIGVAFGPGDGSTTFALPNCQGRTVAGLDPTGTILTAMSPNGNTVGAMGGEQSHVLSGNEMPYHNHGGVDHYHTSAGGQSQLYANYGPHWFDGGGGTNYVGLISTTGAADRNLDTGFAGASWGHNNVQPTILGSWIIKT